MEQVLAVIKSVVLDVTWGYLEDNLLSDEQLSLPVSICTHISGVHQVMTSAERLQDR